ncbi:MAG: DNA polymerase IV [Patescibacteria group bacterium]|nr:DNA polymerase IV [Patescibacteria group bacterium]
MNKTVLHLDFDSFFASCEQHFNPNLRNKPIGVTAEHGRTCIIAASKEAKKFGIKTGTRSWEAKRILPNITFVPADFERYYEITKKFLSICKDYSPIVELFSIDELFIDLTPTIHLYSSIEHVVKDIKKRVRNEIGATITLSAGVSYNKLLAKLASGKNKPDGFFIIERSNLPEIYKNTKLTDICGIGERIGKRLNALSIYSFVDLQKASQSVLKKEFGPAWAFQLKKFAFLEDDLQVLPYNSNQVIKSVGRNYCLPKNEYNQTKILQTIYELCSEIGLKLRKLNKKGRTIGLSLAGERNASSEKTIGRFINQDKDIFEVCKFLYNSWEWNCFARQVSVWVTNLTDANTINYSIFDNPKKESVIKTVDQINEKFGDRIIRNGFLIYVDKLKTKPNGYLADGALRTLVCNISSSTESEHPSEAEDRN